MKNTVAIITILLLTVVAPVGAAVTMDVRPATTYQSVEGIGGGVVYYLDWIAKHQKSEELYDTIFNGLGLSALRIGNWAQDEDADLTMDSLIYAAAKKRLGDKFFVTMASWAPPAYMKCNDDMKGTNQNADEYPCSLKYVNGKGFMYSEFAAWWKRSLEQYRKVGIYPDYVSIQNEVDCNPGYYAMTLAPEEIIQGNKMNASYARCLKDAAKEINSLPNPPKIIGPEVLGIGWDRVQNYVSKCDKSLLSAYSFHYYHSGKTNHDDVPERYSFPDEFRDAMEGMYEYFKKEDKPLFMTENSTLRDPEMLDPIYTAWFMTLGFTVNHVASYIHWNLIWGDEGDACINIDTLFVDGKYQKIEGGYRVNGNYHAVRHFSKFVQHGWKLLYATTDNPDVLITAFKSPEDDAYTVILVNKGTKQEIDCSTFNPDSCLATVIQSDVPAESWSKVLGTYEKMGKLSLPSNSITTIAYRKPKPVVPLSYQFKGDTVRLWNDTAAWIPSGVPSSIDTVLVGDGSLFASDLTATAPFTLGRSARLSLYGENHFSEMTSLGGNMLFDTLSTLQIDSLVVEEQTTILVASQDTTARVELSGAIYGNSIINKIGTDTLIVSADGAAYEGTWIMAGGALRMQNSTAIGAKGIDVVLGTLYVDSSATTNRLYVGHDGKLVLNALLEVKSVMLGADTLYGGVYTAEDFPEFLEGDGKLFVNLPRPSLVKAVTTDSVQIVEADDSIKPLRYTWENADSVAVDWYPIHPCGIRVDMDDSLSAVTISGKSDTAGTFDYKISTRGIYGPTASDSGRFIFKAPAPSIAKNNLSDNAHAYYADGALSICSDVALGYCYVYLTDMSGRMLFECSVDMNERSNSIRVGDLRMGAYLLHICGKGIYKTLKIVVD